MVTKANPEFQSSRSWDGSDRRAFKQSETPSMDVVVMRLERMEETQGKIEASLEKLAESMARLALNEERISYLNEALSRAFKDIEKLATAVEARLANLEKVAPLNNQARVWVQAALIGLAVAACAYVGFHTGLTQGK